MVRKSTAINLKMSKCHSIVFSLLIPYVLLKKVLFKKHFENAKPIPIFEK